ncbi:MAG TPA: cell envelope integrity protein TolA [Acidobacteriaceae bacterium]|nr:cell envelope integrity protein TolA [Acidobacteriaceae bacterium]
MIFHLFVFWWIFYGPKLKIFRPATVVNTMPAVPEKAPENVYLDMPPELVKKPPPKPTNTISDQNHTAQTKNPTPDQKTIQELQAMRRAGRPSPPPQPQQKAQQPEQPAARPQQPTPQQEQARAAPPSAAPPQSLPSAPNANSQQMTMRQPESRQSKAQMNQATSQPNMSVGDMIRQAERNAARSNGEAGDNGENVPMAHPGVASGVEVLSDTMGVDFGPYLHQVVQMTQSSWDLLIPEAARPPLLKQGTVAIQFIILPDGSIKQMQLVRPSGDVSLDRAAWGGITGAGPFPPLPKQFKGPYLALRFYFLYNEQTGQYTRQ